jgi:hypothetical protein
MLQTLVEAGIIILCMAGIAYMAGMGAATVAESRVRERLRSENLDERHQRLLRLAQRLQKRRDDILPGLIRLDADLKSNLRANYMVTKRVSDTKISRSRLLRVLGEEEAFLRPERIQRQFVAHVVNRKMQRAQLEQKELPNLARSWGRAQMVIAYALNIADAKALVEKHFPTATGYELIDITEPDTAELAAGPVPVRAAG